MKDFKTFKNIFGNINPEKLKGLKIAGTIGGSILGILYLAFLIVPHFININNFMGIWRTVQARSNTYAIIFVQHMCGYIWR